MFELASRLVGVYKVNHMVSATFQMCSARKEFPLIRLIRPRASRWRTGIISIAIEFHMAWSFGLCIEDDHPFHQGYGRWTYKSRMYLHESIDRICYFCPGFERTSPLGPPSRGEVHGYYSLKYGLGLVWCVILQSLLYGNFLSRAVQEGYNAVTSTSILNAVQEKVWQPFELNLDNIVNRFRQHNNSVADSE